MDSKERNAVFQNQEINKNAGFEIETSLNASTSTKSSIKSLDNKTSLKISNNTPNTNIIPIEKSENKRKVNSQVTVSPPQKRFEVLNSSVKKAIGVRSPTKSNCSPLHFKSSQLRISGQKIVDESVSENRPMKCCNYDVPDIISPMISNSHKSFMQSNVTATSLMRKQQLREHHMKKVRMMQQNMMINYKSPDKLITHEDLIQIKKGIDYLERKQKIAEETKKKERNPEIQNSNFVNLLPTIIL